MQQRVECKQCVDYDLSSESCHNVKAITAFALTELSRNYAIGLQAHYGGVSKDFLRNVSIQGPEYRAGHYWCSEGTTRKEQKTTSTEQIQAIVDEMNSGKPLV